MLASILEDVRTFPADAALVWRHRGLRGVRVELMFRTVFRVVRWARLWVFEQDLTRYREQPPPTGVTIEVFAGDWSELTAITTHREIRSFRRAAAKGRVCLLARRDGRPIGYTWNSYAIDPEIETYPIPLPAGAAYGWNLFVVPSERGSGTGTALVSARLAHARGHGCTRSWRLIAPENRASRRTIEKTSGGGGLRIATLTYVRLGRRVFARYVPIPVEAVVDAARTEPA